jgi:dienelactone hydrolase
MLTAGGCGGDGDALTPGQPTGAGGAAGPAVSGPSGGGIHPLNDARPPMQVLGHWYLNHDGQRVTLSLEASDVSGAVHGYVTPEGTGATPRAIADVTYDRIEGQLLFHTFSGTDYVWYRLQLREGIAAGRTARTTASTAPADPVAYTGRLTGWRDETFSAQIVPRVWDIAIDTHQRAVLRVDQASSAGGGFVGRLKLYATDFQLDEQLSEDIQIERWDGTTLTFVRPAAKGERFTGTASGRLINGTFADQHGSPSKLGTWNGARAEVLSHGLTARLPAAAQDWQARTRARLGWLVMNGNPAPLTANVTEVATNDPIPYMVDIDNRDDDAIHWAQQYRLSELAFEFTLPSPTGHDALIRRAHGFIAVPSTPPPAGGYPVALAINGHWGSSLQVFDPQNPYYWYGDSFARRGYVVISVDIGHRPLEDRAALYGDAIDGDEPVTGNGTHPAIKAPGMTSDWEETGERAWDAMRALDYVLARPDVNAQRVTMLGLSMGGEVTDWVGALDTRIAATVAAGSPTDLAVETLHGNHPCWLWQRGDAREYVDPADLEALVAPRTVIRETGHNDNCYSNAKVPFASAKQVVRRAQPAFDALGGKLIHYLHFDVHDFHVGQYCERGDTNAGVTTPIVSAPDATDPWSTDWQNDDHTAQVSATIFDQLP